MQAIRIARRVAPAAILVLLLVAPSPALAGRCDNHQYRYERGLVFQSLRQQERQLQLDLADQPRDVQRRVLRQFRIDKRRVMRIWIDANPCK